MAPSRPGFEPGNSRSRATSDTLPPVEERCQRGDQDTEPRYQRDRHPRGRHLAYVLYLLLTDPTRATEFELT